MHLYPSGFSFAMAELALSIKDLKKTYKNGVEALKGISLDVKKGEFFALLGPNGAGKSTTIGIITSLVNKSSGTVEVFGNNIDTNLNSAKKHIGIVPQEFNFSIFEDVLDIVINQAGYYGIPRKVARERAEFYLKKLGLWEKKDAQTRTLSGGLKRRLMIARALVHEPDILILDEPTAGVDIELRRGMYDFLKELNRNGTTIILTTHYFEEAELLCKYVAIIDKGILKEKTSIKQLLLKMDTHAYSLDIIPGKIPEDIANLKITRVDEHTIEVEFHKKTINDVIHLLESKGMTIVGIRPKANRLEEYFLSVVRQK
jgi:ABC-2 type transport system ATP-binding protein